MALSNNAKTANLTIAHTSQFNQLASCLLLRRRTKLLFKIRLCAHDFTQSVDRALRAEFIMLMLSSFMMLPEL